MNQVAKTAGRPVHGITRTTLLKDLRLEWRSKDAINSMLFFALLVVVIFSFAFNPTAEESRRIAGGLVWVAFLFAAVVALNQTWARELRNQVLDADDAGAETDADSVGQGDMGRERQGDFELGSGFDGAVEVEKDSAGAHVLGLGMELANALETDNGGQAHVKAPHHPPVL